jgi:hypothetical protein
MCTTARSRKLINRVSRVDARRCRGPRRSASVTTLSSRSAGRADPIPRGPRVDIDSRIAARSTRRAIGIAIAEAPANPFETAETLRALVGHCRARARHSFGDRAEQGADAHAGSRRVRDVASKERAASHITNGIADGTRERRGTRRAIGGLTVGRATSVRSVIERSGITIGSTFRRDVAGDVMTGVRGRAGRSIVARVSSLAGGTPASSEPASTPVSRAAGLSAACRAAGLSPASRVARLSPGSRRAIDDEQGRVTRRSAKAARDQDQGCHQRRGARARAAPRLQVSSGR